MSERSWLLPSVLLTLGLGAVALLISPNYSGILPALDLLPVWLFASGALAAVTAYFRMMLSGVKSPLRHIAHSVREDWRRLLTVAVGVTLAGLNMIAFMWVKPLLNHFVAFRADPLLAGVDRLLFLGRDPWTLLQALNSSASAIFYHRGWFALMIVTLLVVLWRGPSPQKSALMLTYFLLWSVAGPMIHILLPAAGPVFFGKLGYGQAFAGIPVPPETAEMITYLWNVYRGERFGPGSGISAMPSLHIATTAWMVLAVHVLARRWTWAMALPGILIFLLSISLGWHYAVDGIVGAAAALGCYWLCERFYDGRLALRPRLQRAPEPAGAIVD